jgi:hypothetical protein
VNKLGEFDENASFRITCINETFPFSAFPASLYKKDSVFLQESVSILFPNFENTNYLLILLRFIINNIILMNFLHI